MVCSLVVLLKFLDQSLKVLRQYNSRNKKYYKPSPWTCLRLFSFCLAERRDLVWTKRLLTPKLKTDFWNTQKLWLLLRFLSSWILIFALELLLDTEPMGAENTGVGRWIVSSSESDADAHLLWMKKHWEERGTTWERKIRNVKKTHSQSQQFLWVLDLTWSFSRLFWETLSATVQKKV